MASGSKTPLIAFVLLLACLLAGFPALRSEAASDLTVETLTGFAFFKFAKVEPDFKTWVEHAPAYQQGSPRERVTMMQYEVPLLQNLFANHVVGDHPITVKATVTLEIPSSGKAKRMLAQQGAITIDVKFSEENGGFFAVPVADMWIALIPRDLDEFMTLAFTEEEFNEFKSTLAAKGLSGTAKANLKLRLLPIGADIKSPLRINDFDLWMLMADIVSFELWSPEHNSLVWSMAIEGYDQFNLDKDIYNLYEN